MLQFCLSKECFKLPRIFLDDQQHQGHEVINQLELRKEVMSNGVLEKVKFESDKIRQVQITLRRNIEMIQRKLQDLHSQLEALDIQCTSFLRVEEFINQLNQNTNVKQQYAAFELLRKMIYKQREEASGQGREQMEEQKSERGQHDSQKIQCLDLEDAIPVEIRVPQISKLFQVQLDKRLKVEELIQSIHEQTPQLNLEFLDLFPQPFPQHKTCQECQIKENEVLYLIKKM